MEAFYGATKGACFPLFFHSGQTPEERSYTKQLERKGLLQGDTIFAPLEEVVASLPTDQRERWERLHMLSDRRGGVAQPLIYPHPITGMLFAMCIPALLFCQVYVALGGLVAVSVAF